MEFRRWNELLHDPAGLVAHYEAIFEQYSGDPLVRGGAPLDGCGLVFLSPASVDAVRPLVREPRFPRRITLRQLDEAGYGVRDSEPIVAGRTTVGSWQVLIDTGRNWPTLAITPEDSVDGGRAVVVDWTAKGTVVTDYVDGRIVVAADLAEGPLAVPLGTDLGGYRAAVSGLPWHERSDLRAVALAVAARLTGEVLGTDFFDGTFRKVFLEHRLIDRSDLLREFHDYAAAHEPALLAIVADTACGPESTRQIAVQSALQSVRLGGVAADPPIVEALHVLTNGPLPDGDPAWNRYLLDLIEPRAAYVRERISSGPSTGIPPPSWFALLGEVGGYRATAAAFLTDPYEAAAHAWVSSGAVSWYLPGTKIFRDDHIRKEILVRCLYRARDSGRYRI